MTTSQLVKRFVERDWLEQDARGKLLPGRRFHALRLLGTIKAGFPSPAEEEWAGAERGSRRPVSPLGPIPTIEP